MSLSLSFYLSASLSVYPSLNLSLELQKSCNIIFKQKNMKLLCFAYFRYFFDKIFPTQYYHYVFVCVVVVGVSVGVGLGEGMNLIWI